MKFFKIKANAMFRIHINEDIDIIGAVRKDTAIYDLKPEPTGKRGRPKTNVIS